MYTYAHKWFTFKCSKSSTTTKGVKSLMSINVLVVERATQKLENATSFNPQNSNSAKLELEKT